MILTYLLQEDDCRIEPGSSFLKGSTRHPALAQPRRPRIPTSQPPDGGLESQGEPQSAPKAVPKPQQLDGREMV